MTIDTGGWLVIYVPDVTVYCSLVCQNIKGSGVPLYRYGTALQIWHCRYGTVK